MPAPNVEHEINSSYQPYQPYGLLKTLTSTTCEDGRINQLYTARFRDLQQRKIFLSFYFICMYLLSTLAYLCSENEKKKKKLGATKV